MFEGIQQSLSDAFKKLRGRGRIKESNIHDAMQEVRRALLDADVNFDVVETFTKRVTEKAVGQTVLRSLDPSEQIIKIVYDELVALMGPVDTDIRFVEGRPTIIMLCGLQGQGKTTTAGKLALTLRGQGRKPLLVGADLQRPAAVEQIRVLGEQIDVPVFSESSSPVEVCRKAVGYAKDHELDTIILDTAGRLHVAEMPMDELRQIDRLVKPNEVYLVCDGMTGQDAVNSAKAFNDALDINGVILTKMDGDARGGAAISVKEVTQVPIKFMGVGEKLDRLEPFEPEGIAQRILGQGDLMGLVRKVQQVQSDMDQEELQRQQEKLATGDFTLDDFRKQFEQLKKMGPMKDLMGHLPGMGDMIGEDENPEEAIKRIQGMIDSMTKAERTDPDIIDLSRRRRIAEGSGTQAHEIKQFLNQFEQIRHLMREMANMSTWQKFKMMTGMSKMDGFLPGAGPIKKKASTGHRKTPKERAKERKKKRKR